MGYWPVDGDLIFHMLGKDIISKAKNEIIQNYDMQ
jgi:hypothetical protein